MKKEDLFDTLGDINNQYIKEAHKRKIILHGLSWGTVAACFAVVLVTCVTTVNYLSSTVDDNTPSTETSGEVTNNPIAELQAERVENDNKKEDSVGKPEDFLLVANKADSVSSFDMDVKIITSAKLTENVWSMILDEFHELVGVSYEEFTARVPDTWEVVNFYFASIPGYKDGWVEEEYRLHDYVFACRTENGGEATIALCTFAEPLRDYFIICDNPEKSQIKGVSLIIYEYENMYMTQFSHENVNYDIEARNVSLEELENLLTGILVTSDAAPNTQTDSTLKTDIEDAPADPNGTYMEAVNSDDLTKDTSEFFGGSYIDNNGKFVVVLTEDTPANRTSICKELGRSESNTTFEKGTYTLAYLTELQAKISNAMVNKQLPFVVSSRLRETTNNIVVGVTTTDESELAKVYALDTLGGAIKIEFSSNATTDLLPAPKAE